MKQQTKSSQIFIMLVLITLAVLCVTNVTYSYFTATAKAEDSASFGDLNVKFVYKETENSQTTTAESGTIELFSSTGAIQREVEFAFSLTEGGNPINRLAIQNFSGSCDCYVRFWIDAYIVTNGVVDKTTNYGKYFFLYENPSDPVYTRSDSSVANSWCYFFITKLSPNPTSNRTIGTTLELKDVSTTDVVPVELLGEQLQITISLEAVQVANQAYLSVFGAEGDTKGYYTGWGET